MPTTVTVNGTITFDSVPSVAGIGLDYLNTQPKPARGVTVELLNGANVLASTTTDSAGGYSFAAAPRLDVSLRVRAELIRVGTPAWTFTVLDNVSGDALYTLEGAVFNTGTANSTRDLRAASGWDGSRYGGTRSAAPFAILDTVYDAVQLVLGASPDTSFPPLQLHWSTANVTSFGANGIPDLDTGEIGNSFFRPGLGIVLLGAEDGDTDEYDRHVIAHEWGHYVEEVFSRSDSIGGPHTRHDQLDFRVAFGEGWGNAFSAMVTGESVYRDSFGPSQSGSFAFDIEGPLSSAQGNQNPGWYSEESVQELIYDLFDSNVDLIRNSSVADNVALGFAPLYAALAGPQKTTSALTSVFPFVDALRTQRPADAPLIDDVVTAQNITQVADVYGTSETHFGNPPTADLESVYEQLTVNDPTPLRVCSLDDYRSTFTGSTNKLGSQAVRPLCGGQRGLAHRDRASRCSSERRGRPRYGSAPGGANHYLQRRAEQHVQHGRAARLFRDVLPESRSGRPCARGLRMDQHQHGHRRVPADRPHVLRRDGDAALSGPAPRALAVRARRSGRRRARSVLHSRAPPAPRPRASRFA